MYYRNKDRSVITSNSNTLKPRNLVDRTSLINRKYNYVEVPTTTPTNGAIGSKLITTPSKPITSNISLSLKKPLNNISPIGSRDPNQLVYTWSKQLVASAEIENAAVWYSPTKMMLSNKDGVSKYYEIHVPYGQLCNLPIITSSNGTIITKTTYDVLVQNSNNEWISIFYCCPDLLQHYYIYDTYCVLQLKNSTEDTFYSQYIMIKVNPLDDASLPIVHYKELPITQTTTDIISTSSPEPFLLRLNDEGEVIGSEKLDANYNYIYTSRDKIAL